MNVSSGYLTERKPCHTRCNKMASLLCVAYYVSSGYLTLRKPCCTGCSQKASLFRWPDVEKALLHRVQPKGFSPVCDFLCLLRLPDLEKSLPHLEQENVWFPLWDNRWVFSVPDFEKHLSQKEQANIVSMVFNIWCLISSPETVILMSSILARGSADTAGQDQHWNLT